MHPSALSYQFSQLVDRLPLLDVGPERYGKDHDSADDTLARTGFAVEDDITLAIPSLLGMSFVLIVDGHDVVFTSMVSGAETEQLASSLRIPLAAIARNVQGDVVFYASTPGALVDLAADLEYALQLDEGELRIDEHLHTIPTSGVVGAEELSVTNRAVGFLMGGGFTVEAAQQHLREREEATGQTPMAVAEQLLRAGEPMPRDPNRVIPPIRGE